MNHHPTTDIAMACSRITGERPARVYSFDFMMDNPRNQDPQTPLFPLGKKFTYLSLPFSGV
jgi:hypothetical protein